MKPKQVEIAEGKALIGDSASRGSSSAYTLPLSSGSEGQVLALSSGSAASWTTPPFLSNAAADTLGGDLDVGDSSIVSSSNKAINLAPNGSGVVTVKGNATGGSGALKLNCENNSHGVTVKGPPHSAGANYTLTLPNDDGDADQVLKTNGSGVLSWVDQSSGGGGAAPRVKRVTSSYTLQLSDLDTTSPLYVLYEGTSGFFAGLPDPSSLLASNTQGGASTDTIVAYFGRTNAGNIYFQPYSVSVNYMNGGGAGYTNPNEFIKCIAYKDSGGSTYWIIEETQAHLDYNHYRTFSSNTAMINVYQQDQHYSIDTTGNNFIAQLPASSPTGGEWRFINFRGSNYVRIDTASNQKIYPANTTSITLTAGQSCLLIRGYNDSTSAAHWERMY